MKVSTHHSKEPSRIKILSHNSSSSNIDNLLRFKPKSRDAARKVTRTQANLRATLKIHPYVNNNTTEGEERRPVTTQNGSTISFHEINKVNVRKIKTRSKKSFGKVDEY